MAEKLGLVLSGGGSKGAYEMGVYKALRRLGKVPDIVTGTSVGAINGLFIVQNEPRKATRMWKNISFSTLYDEKSFSICDNSSIASVYGQYVKAFISEGGMNVDKLSKLLDRYYDPKKFFSSKIDFGLITYNLSKNSPVAITKREMTVSNAKDYVMASASCYPAFKPYVIDGDLYIDGGYYDNMPINLAISMGATNIIAVNLKAVGFTRLPSTDVPILIISPRNKITSFLVFDKVKSREAIDFGYNDTMKTFHKLDGNKFTFKKGDLVRNYNNYSGLFEDNLKFFEFSSLKKYNYFDDKRTSYKSFNSLLEKAGFCFELPENNIYNIRKFNNLLRKALFNVSAISYDDILNKIKAKKIKNIVDRKQIVKFFYEAIESKKNNNLFKFISAFSDEFLIAIYIYSVNGKFFKN